MPTAKKLPSGSWRCQVFSRYEDGKNIRKSFTAATKREAERLAAEYACTKKDITTCGLTMGAAIDQYILNREAILSPRTISEYRSFRRLYCQSIMQTPVSDITQEMIQEAVNYEAQHLNPKSVRNIHGLISAVMRTYRPEFALRTVLPKNIRPTIYVPSDEEIARLVAFCEGSDMELPILLAAFGPMRRGEISALTTDNIQDNTVHVCQSMVLGPDKSWIIKSPKSYAGDRFITYPDFVAEKWQGREGFVTDLKPDTISHRFEHILKGAGLPHFRFHDLRHYSASVQHALGIPDSYIMQRGGWGSDAVLKNVYRHTMADQTAAMNDKANGHFEELLHTKLHTV